MTPSEGPAENIRNALQVIALARYAKTKTGEPGRILTDEELKTVITRLMRAVRQIESAERAALPSHA